MTTDRHRDANNIIQVTRSVYGQLPRDIDKISKDLVLEITTIFYIPNELSSHCYLEVLIENSYRLASR